MDPVSDQRRVSPPVEGHQHQGDRLGFVREFLVPRIPCVSPMHPLTRGGPSPIRADDDGVLVSEYTRDSQPHVAMLRYNRDGCDADPKGDARSRDDHGKTPRR